ncbi:MAG: hypothetical protein L3J97_01820 [Thermoplasmata archaeon]|nr:hypothetical protein [Thermoplasmata archaeon]
MLVFGLIYGIVGFALLGVAGFLAYHTATQGGPIWVSLIWSVGSAFVALAIFVGYYFAIFRCARPLYRGDFAGARAPTLWLAVGSFVSAGALAADRAWPFVATGAILGSLYLLTYAGLRIRVRASMAPTTPRA